MKFSDRGLHDEEFEKPRGLGSKRAEDFRKNRVLRNFYFVCFDCKAGPYVHRNSPRTGTGFRFFNSCSVSSRISGHFSCSNRAEKKMEQDFERIRGSKSRISQILFLFGGIPVYIRTSLRGVEISVY